MVKTVLISGSWCIHTGIMPVCQSWQCITWGFHPPFQANSAAALAKKDNAVARALVKDARDLVAAMPVTEAEAASPEMRAAFTGGKQKTARQAELEQQWASFAKEKYAAAKAKADEAAKLAK